MEPARLEGIPLFADLDDEQRAQVAACMREQDGRGGHDASPPRGSSPTSCS